MTVYRLGELLRELRQQRGLSQTRLAERAQVTTRALRYWEADQQQPREMELEAVLKALEATPQERGRVYALLSDQRTVRQARSAEAAHQVPTALLGPLPGLGDLLRAMRLRRGWTQEQFAEALRVNRATVIRWEATRVLPGEEDMERVCHALRASPQERGALMTRRLSLSTWPAQLTLEECQQQYEMVSQTRRGDRSLVSLMDLHLLALKRQIRLLLGQSTEALRLLAKVEVLHGWWLYMQGRSAEACAANWRALNLARGTLAAEQYWVEALNILSAHAARSARGPENGVKLLYPWLHLLPVSFYSWLLCDLAFYAGQAEHHDEATYFLHRAQQALLCRPQMSPGEERHFHLTQARVLLSAGKPIEALDWLPPLSASGDGNIHELLIWAETYLAAGDKQAMARCISEAQTLLVDMPLPQRQCKLEQLARKI